jgi:hypothetical protein
MKARISGPVATAILVLTCVAILVAGYLYVRDPPRIPPEETLRMMRKAQSQPQKPPPPSTKPGSGPRTEQPNVH